MKEETSPDMGFTQKEKNASVAARQVEISRLRKMANHPNLTPEQKQEIHNRVDRLENDIAYFSLQPTIEEENEE